MTTTQKLTYTNHTDSDARLIIEPWAEEFVIRPEQQVEIIVESDAPGILDIQQRARGLVIYGHAGCTIEVMSDGKPLPPSDQT